MPRVTLIHPPYRDPEAAPIAMAKAAARWRRAGTEVVALDANQAFWADWLDPAFLSEKLERIAAERRRLEALPRLEDADAYAYYRALNAVAGSPPPLAELAGAVAALAPGAGARRERAKAILDNLLDVALWPTPGLAVLNDLTLAASSESSADVVGMAGGGHDENPFFRFWSRWLGAHGAIADDLVALWLDEDQQLIPAAALAFLLRAGGRASRVALAGPFAALLDEIDAANGASWRRGLFDAPSPDGHGAALAPGELAAELKALEEQRSSGFATPALALEAEPDASGLPDLARVAREMAEVRAAFPAATLHLRDPLPASRLPALARAVAARGDPPRWGTMVKFGFSLDRADVEAARDAGCGYLHFEVKGFAGYGGEDAALAAMLSSFETARRGGLKTLASLVYGYPGDSEASFGRFIAAMKPRRDAVDRWVRLKIYRLYRNTPAWARPAEHGVRTRLPPPEGLDLARHSPFVSETGLSSNDFPAKAQAALAAFGRARGDFPASPLVGDEVWREPPPDEAATELAPGDFVASVPDAHFDPTPFRFAALEEAFRGYAPGPGRPLPAVAIPAGPPERIARAADGTGILAVGAGLSRILEACRTPVEVAKLAPRLAKASGGDGLAMLGKLVERGLLRKRESQTALRGQPHSGPNGRG